MRDLIKDNMKIIDADIKDVKFIKLDVLEDNRGYFSKIHNEEIFNKIIGNYNFVLWAILYFLVLGLILAVRINYYFVLQGFEFYYDSFYILSIYFSPL